MGAKSVISRLRSHDWDWEKIGRALIEYAGVPLAVFMAVGVIVNVLQGYGRYHEFFDPLSNYHMYFVINVWLVTLIYFYRKKYQPSLTYTDRTEIGLAAVPALTWILTQPFLLIIGYAAYLVAILRHDTLHGSFLPDIESEDTDDDTDPERGWGHLQEIKEHMT